ncbi:hypothetical protein KA405_02350 [Patescibacteria group bacterium]|nr:hypothetical protein [Patescibacteria group bacterium]
MKENYHGGKSYGQEIGLGSEKNEHEKNEKRRKVENEEKSHDENEERAVHDQRKVDGFEDYLVENVIKSLYGLGSRDD